MKQMVEDEINRLVNILIEEQNPDGSWSYPFETGISTDCYMIILLRTLEINDEDLIHSLVRRILSKQGENGAGRYFMMKKGTLQQPLKPIMRFFTQVTEQKMIRTCAWQDNLF